MTRTPGFSSKFKEDLAWWFKQDFDKASKILDLVTAVMQNPFEGIGKPEPLKYMDADISSRVSLVETVYLLRRRAAACR